MKPSSVSVNQNPNKLGPFTRYSWAEITPISRVTTVTTYNPSEFYIFSAIFIGAVSVHHWFLQGPPTLDTKPGGAQDLRPKRRRRRKAGCPRDGGDGGGWGMLMLSHKNRLVVATQTSYQVQTSKLVSVIFHFKPEIWGDDPI